MAKRYKPFQIKDWTTGHAALCQTLTPGEATAALLKKHRVAIPKKHKMTQPNEAQKWILSAPAYAAVFVFNRAAKPTQDSFYWKDLNALPDNWKEPKGADMPTVAICWLAAWRQSLKGSAAWGDANDPRWPDTLLRVAGGLPQLVEQLSTVFDVWEIEKQWPRKATDIVPHWVKVAESLTHAFKQWNAHPSSVATVAEQDAALGVFVKAGRLRFDEALWPTVNEYWKRGTTLDEKLERLLDTLAFLGPAEESLLAGMANEYTDSVKHNPYQFPFTDFAVITDTLDQWVKAGARVQDDPQRAARLNDRYPELMARLRSSRAENSAPVLSSPRARHRP